MARTYPKHDNRKKQLKETELRVRNETPHSSLLPQSSRFSRFTLDRQIADEDGRIISTENMYLRGKFQL